MGSLLIQPQPEPRWPPGFFREQFHVAQRYRAEHGDELPTTPFWRYLEHREGLDPARFAHWHPIVARWIREDQWLRRHDAGSPPGESLVPPIAPQDPAGVPEPSSWVLLVIGMIVVWLVMKQHNKQEKQ